VARAELVQDPRHYLLVGIDIRRRNISIRPHEAVQTRDIHSGQSLEFTAGHLRGITNDATFGASKGQAYERRLPGHDFCERVHRLATDGRVVSNTSLRRAKRSAVLDAIAVEHFQ
jgi:hypothetical protein